MSDLSDTIEQTAKGAARVSFDGVSVDHQSIAELIAADRYLKANTAAARNHLGLTVRKLEPPGAG